MSKNVVDLLMSFLTSGGPWNTALGHLFPDVCMINGVNIGHSVGANCDHMFRIVCTQCTVINLVSSVSSGMRLISSLVPYTDVLTLFG